MDQTYENFELLVCDNASTDSTPDIVGAWAQKDERVRSLRADENVGANHNFNRAFRHSGGELFKWAAHDDLLSPSYLAQCVTTLVERPDLALCHTRTELIDATGLPLLLMDHASVDSDG